MNDARKDLETQLSDINNQLFTNPNTLLQRIQKESKLLKEVLCIIFSLDVFSSNQQPSIFLCKQIAEETNLYTRGNTCLD